MSHDKKYRKIFETFIEYYCRNLLLNPNILFVINTGRCLSSFLNLIKVEGLYYPDIFVGMCGTFICDF